jgi:hypothetical protein
MEVEESTFFVFYTYVDGVKNPSWDYDDFPSDWKWVGSGTTSPVGGAKLKYQFEEQFVGSSNYKKLMKNILKMKFDSLVESGIIKIFKIRDSYKI